MILEKASQPKITEAQELSETKRDQKGFGSTDQAASLTEDRAQAMLIFKDLVKGKEV